MKYNQSFFVFIYFCMVINPLYTMQSSLINTAKNRLITKNTKINAIIKKEENSENNVTKDLTKIYHIYDGKLSSELSYDNSLQYMYYNKTGDAFVAMDKTQGCFIVKKQGNDIHKISNIICNNYDICRRKIAINDETIIIAGKKDIELYNIRTSEKKLLEQKKAKVFSICFSSENDCILTLSEGNNNDGHLRKYNKNGNFIDELITAYPGYIKFTTYQSLLLIVNDLDQPQITLELYNLLDFTLQKKYTISDLINKNLHNLNPIKPAKHCESCQISDDGLVALIGKEKSFSTNKLYIFDAANQKQLNFKYAIDCEGLECAKFYPTTSIILTISYLSALRHFIRYWDVKTGVCLYKALVNGIDYIIRSIDFSPYGNKVAITSYGCILEKVPTHIACNHAKNRIRYLLLLNELCNQNQKFCGIIPQEIKRLIAQNIFV